MISKKYKTKITYFATHYLRVRGERTGQLSVTYTILNLVYEYSYRIASFRAVFIVSEFSKCHILSSVIVQTWAKLLSGLGGGAQAPPPSFFKITIEFSD